jgi:hypothetical protein
MKPSVEYFLDGHENQNSNENLQFRHNTPYPIHLSLCVSSFKVLVSINVGHDTKHFQDISGPKQKEKVK